MDIPQTAWKWRRQTWLILIIGLMAILIGLVVSFASATFRPTTEVRIGSSGVYELWLADDSSSLYTGLSGVTELPRNGGLLMDFKAPGLHGIVMRDMKIPLDIVWLDETKEVVYVVKNASPSHGEVEPFVPKTPARYVLELPAGSVSNSAIKAGSKAEFTIRDTQ